MKSAKTLHRYISHVLGEVYPIGEAQAIANILIGHFFGLNRTEILLDAPLPPDCTLPEDVLPRLLAHEPVQYVLGTAPFCGRNFGVSPSVLIPRPETEELIGLIQTSGISPKTILDLGTGSGCIAITLALAYPHAYTEAWDVSEAALAQARTNAATLGADVNFLLMDILTPTIPEKEWELIVSNPPYVTASEAAEILPNVLAHEPHLALFVPDNDPLVFYRAIGQFARKGLVAGGKLFVEINTQYGQETVHLFENQGFINVSLHQDFHSRDRFIKAQQSFS